jgi:hypothetical protein
MTDRELEIVARLKDEITYKLNDIHKSFKKLDSQTRTSNKQMGGFNKNVRDSLKPLTDLRANFMRVTGLVAVGTAVWAGYSKVISEVSDKLSEVDKLSIRLGISTEELSKKAYGTNLDSPGARAAALADAESGNWFKKQWSKLQSTIANARGNWKRNDTISGNAFNIQQEERRRLGRELTTEEVRATYKKATELTDKQIKERTQEFKQNSIQALQLTAEIKTKTDQLTLSAFEFKRQKMIEEVALYRQAGADEQQVKAYQAAFEKSLDSERLTQIKKMQADRLEAQGQTYAAMELRDQAALEEFKRKFGTSGEMVNEFKKGQEAIRQQKSVLNQTLKSIAGDLSDSLANNMTSFKDFVSEAGSAILSTLKQVAAQYVISATLGRINPAFNLLGMTFHKGGVIRAHSGLAVDEVPIIAQTGEGVLSRRGMSALGRSNFEQLNRGKSIGGGETVVNYYIYANDAKSFVSMLYQNKEAIHGLVTENVARNGAIRGSMKKYA